MPTEHNCADCLCQDTHLQHCVVCGELTILTRMTWDKNYTDRGAEFRQYSEPYCGCGEPEIEGWPI